VLSEKKHLKKNNFDPLYFCFCWLFVWGKLC